MGLSVAFFTVFVKGVGGVWGIRVCFAALGAVMLVVCGAGALILQDPPPKPKSGKPQPGPDFDYKQMLRTPQYKLCVAAVEMCIRDSSSSARYTCSTACLISISRSSRMENTAVGSETVSYTHLGSSGHSS